MYSKRMTYKDFNGEERTETFMFNLTKAELAKMELNTKGGMKQKIKTLFDSKDIATIVDQFESIIQAAYGVKSEDGRRFVKSKELLDDFMATEAYSDLYIEMIGDSEKAFEFLSGIMPEEIRASIAEKKANGELTEEALMKELEA